MKAGIAINPIQAMMLAAMSLEALSAFIDISIRAWRGWIKSYLFRLLLFDEQYQR